MHVAVLSNVVLDTAVRHLIGFRATGLSFGNLRGGLEGLKSGADSYEVVIVHLDASDFVSVESLAAFTEDTTKLILDLVNSRKTTFFILNTLQTNLAWDTPFHARHGQTFGQVAYGWMQFLSKLTCDNPNVSFINLEDLSRSLNKREIYSSAFRYFARSPYSAAGHEAIATLYSNRLVAIQSPSKKVIILDLDNTLWGGILNEDGYTGIQISNSGIGRAFQDFQRAIKSQSKKGTLLAVASKNNLDEAMQVLSNHKGMILSDQDFVIVRANWEEKWLSLIEISEELNLGLESFVFLDDSPRERESVRQKLPEVTVPDLPEDPAEYTEWFTNVLIPEHFSPWIISSSDLDKTRQYQRKKLREIEMDTAQESSRAARLEGLGVRLSLVSDDESLAERASQMTQKTNQFNLCVTRLNLAQISSYMHSETKSVLLWDYEDKFGSEGVIGLAMVDVQLEKLENFLISCRVLGRGVEELMLTDIRKFMETQGLDSLSVLYKKTERNKTAVDFFERHAKTFYEIDTDRWEGRIDKLG